MVDKTTARDLAEKIEWIGFRNLSIREKLLVESDLVSISRHLPRLLSLALWKYFGDEPPAFLETRPEEETAMVFSRRDQARQFIEILMRD